MTGLNSCLTEQAYHDVILKNACDVINGGQLFIFILFLCSFLHLETCLKTVDSNKMSNPHGKKAEGGKKEVLAAPDGKDASKARWGKAIGSVRKVYINIQNRINIKRVELPLIHCDTNFDKNIFCF